MLKKLEKQLLTRLRTMGFIVWFFSISFLGYAVLSEIFIKEEASFENMEEAGFTFSNSPIFMESREEKFNLYIASTALAIVGTACFVIFYRKKRKI